MSERIKALLALPGMDTALGIIALLLVAKLADVVTRRILLKVMQVATRRTTWSWDDALLEHGVFKRLAQMVPMLVIYYGIKLIPHVVDALDRLIGNLALAGVVLFGYLAVSATLNALEALFSATPHGRRLSIKSYVQLTKIILFVVAAVLVIAAMMNSKPIVLLSGLGAISAVLLLVFKDTILSLVASVQIASNDMLRVGDWITMPQFNADGDVIDIALHTVKVQNFDKTITTIPTWKLISESYKNWRGMQKAGARRIKRALHLDTGTVRFLDGDEVRHLRRFRLLDGYLESKREELQRWNEALGGSGKVPVNQRRLTNLGTFRAYAQAYLDAHPDINHDFTCMVRQLDPGPTGLPMELYCFTATTDWVAYERIQGDLFDHLIAILPEFGLSPFQQPSGHDLRGLAGAADAPALIAAAAESPPAG
jgi:miniconductance mechanosensitive channel